MKKWFILLTVLLALPVLAQVWEATRLGEQQWELTDTNGEHISWHQTEGEANEHGQVWSLENSGADFITRHTGTLWEMSSAYAQVIIGARSPGAFEELSWTDWSFFNDSGAGSIEVGTPFSADVRQFLNGSEAATATITISHASGDDPTTHGWTAPGSGDNITNDATVTGAGSFDIIATGSGAPVSKPTTAFWSITDPGGTSFAAEGTIYERDLLGEHRTGQAGANEPVSGTSVTANPVAELNDVVPIDISDYACDATVTTGDGDWSKVSNAANDIVCIAAGDHSSKGTMDIPDGGSAGTSRSISGVTLTDPVQVDFSASHGWSTNDIIHCDDAAGGTWQLRWRYFRVTVVDSDSVELQGQDGTGNGLRPAWVDYTSGGACQRPNFKVIRHADDIAVHPAQLADGDRAKVTRVRIEDGTDPTDFVMLIGLSIDHKGLDSSIGILGSRIRASDYLIIDQIHDYNVEALSDITADFKRGGFVIVDGDADSTARFIQMQRNFFDERGTDTQDTDSQWFSMSTNTHIGMRLIQNETSSAMSTWQLEGGSGNEGFYFAENSDYLLTKHLTDCNGNVVGGTTFAADSSAPCAVAETAGAFKEFFQTGRVEATNANRHRIAVVDANIQFGRRSEDGVLSDGGSGGGSYGLSGPSTFRNILWRNNVVGANNRRGLVSLGDGSTTNPREYISLIGNIQHNHAITNNGVVTNWFRAEGTISRHHDIAFGTYAVADDWASFARNENVTTECSVFIDAGGRFGGEPSYVQKNNYGYGNTTDMDGTNDVDGGVVANADMADLVLEPKLWSDPNFTYTLPDVLTRTGSPHVGHCPGVGEAGQGVTDDTVTF